MISASKFHGLIVIASACHGPARRPLLLHQTAKSSAHTGVSSLAERSLLGDESEERHDSHQLRKSSCLP